VLPFHLAVSLDLDAKPKLFHSVLNSIALEHAKESVKNKIVVEHQVISKIPLAILLTFRMRTPPGVLRSPLMNSIALYVSVALSALIHASIAISLSPMSLR
jgi:hypothetical protein